MDIEQIIIGCKKQDRSSQDKLVIQFAPLLMGVCNRYCNDSSIAKDALQETFINIFKYIKSYSGKGSFEGWLRKIAVNSSYKAIKKIRPIHFHDDVNNYQEIHSNIPDVYCQMGKNELLELIQKLPKGQYLVFNMYVIEGYSHKEIAKLLGINASTSRSNLTRARVKLSEMMQESQEINLELAFG